MPNPHCNLCSGTGVIYDWNPKGDSCPECVGGSWHMSSNIKYQKARNGCAVLIVAFTVTLAGMAVLLAHA